MTPKRIMRKRGRPPKADNDETKEKKPRSIRLTDEEMAFVVENARRCRKNFSDYCRCVLLGYKPAIPDPELKDGLFAARKDIINFTNNIRGLRMTKEERSRFLASMPIINTWWRALYAEIEFIKKLMDKI